MKSGDVFIYTGSDLKIHKVKITQVFNDEIDGLITYLEYVNGSVFGEPSRMKTEDFLRVYKAANRNTHCFSCSTELDDQNGEICWICKGIICPEDEMCLCHYKGA
ncbi:hypothetical protein [Bacillus sp. UMB0728]|uniref:hypothetical protein n=1 Tax=Bacillus sp. UMB0728 TaxID=2066052 RepID=UPI000C790329|nr:hypothetical protein [Bacillus sp. UMB0728]PLR72206.1 hypothetical protein CYJ37_11660 [Bacillus sp. UMB0728]